MELNRFARVLADRWRVVALIAVIGFVSAFGFTSLTNRTANASWEALVALRFEPEEGQTADEITTAINDAQGLAQLAAEELLAEYPNSAIFADTASGRLFFRAEGETQQIARERARDLLLAYAGSDRSAEDITAELETLATEAEIISEQIAAIQKTLTPEEQDLVSQHEILDLSIAAVTNAIVSLSTADAGVSEEEREDNRARLSDLQERRTELVQAKRSLPPAPSTELSVREQLAFDGLQRQLEVIGVEYENLSLLSAGVLSQNAQQEPVRVSDLAGAPSSPLINGLIGLVGGVALAVFALAFVTRSRKEVWLAGDVPVPVLGDVAWRRPTSTPGPSWYDTSDGSHRKEAIQAVRTALDGLLPTSGAALAIAADHVGAIDLHAFAVDLATSFASAGGSVLLVGADFRIPIDMTEWNVGEPTLSTVLKVPKIGSVALDDRLSDLIDEVVHTRPGLAVMQSGTSPDSPADALAGLQFRRFLELARERHDLVVVVGGEAESAASQVMMQRVGMAVVALAPGGSTIPHIDEVLADLSQQRVALPGVVMLKSRESRVSIPRVGRKPGQPVQETTPEPLSRLNFYPFPGSKRTATPGDASLDHLALDLEAAGQAPTEGTGMGDTMVTAILETLATTDPNRAQEPVAGYVVARVEDMMTAVPGQANFSEELIDVVLTDGFVPVTPVTGQPSIGERLVGELTLEAGDGRGQELASAMAKVLTGSNYMDPTATLNAWLSREFFSRHLLRTDREPEVWHLTSPDGSLQVLVAGRRLTDQRIGLLATKVVRRTIADKEKALREATEVEDVDQAAMLELEIKDAHLFEVSLGLLRAGKTDEARLSYSWRSSESNPKGWNPIWSEGIRPNIAPLQRLGLLKGPVLTENELDELASE